MLQQLEGQLIYPKVVGSSVGLPAIWILVSVFVGGKLFGIVGMLFFIPLASVLYSLLRLNVNHRLEKRRLSVTAEGCRRRKKKMPSAVQPVSSPGFMQPRGIAFSLRRRTGFFPIPHAVELY